jgi:hypothetical protein
VSACSSTKWTARASTTTTTKQGVSQSPKAKAKSTTQRFDIETVDGRMHVLLTGRLSSEYTNEELRFPLPPRTRPAGTGSFATGGRGVHAVGVFHSPLGPTQTFNFLNKTESLSAVHRFVNRRKAYSASMRIPGGPDAAITIVRASKGSYVVIALKA